MNGLSEGLGDLVTGAASARALENRAGEAPGTLVDEAADGDHTHESACLNCGTRLVGSHCHACGQAAHVHRTLGAFFHDLLHGVFHFEGKFWRTLPLLVWRPGRLTREYIDGRRASYVSPIAMFLFTVFLMFAVFHAVEEHDVLPEGVDPANLEVSIAASEKALETLQAERTKLRAQGRSVEDIDSRIDGQREALDLMREFQEDGSGKPAAKAPQSAKPYSDIPAIDKAVRKFRTNPELAAYKLQTYAYKYSWALIPISVPFLWLLFPFSRRFHFYDHTVFVTYSLCFMSLLVIAAMLANAVGATWLAGLLFFVPPFHMYRQLRGTYGVGTWGGVSRTFLLCLFASTALMIFFMILMAQTSL
ncbi:DUF3667 domain-containing protein [Novosphingobium profundi]|uniref:DUF3667 domain-containing protein n=1 Tax=Novosphingobium profundi TaxID=1774954 RepID=UPI001BDA0529|nr:DUF3667 domain-containing protein [Novosphingobium profundi]MBT0667254.1 DUF3667 domain-containing protein [Novosphingobium profundi]